MFFFTKEIVKSAAKVLLFCDIYNSKKSFFVGNMSLFNKIVHFFDEKEAFGVDFQGQKRTIKHAKKKNANLVEIDVDQEIFEMIYSTFHFTLQRYCFF